MPMKADVDGAARSAISFPTRFGRTAGQVRDTAETATETSTDIEEVLGGDEAPADERSR